MAVCISPGCRATFDDVCHFCPFCGRDNRPPQTRANVPPHPHEYILGGDYCWRCGAPDDLVLEREQDTRRGKLFTLFGTLALGIAFMMATIAGAQDDANYKQVEFERQWLKAEGKLGKGGSGPKFEFSPMGGALPLVVSLGGCASVVYGAIIWINSRKPANPFG